MEIASNTNIMFIFVMISLTIIAIAMFIGIQEARRDHVKFMRELHEHDHKEIL